MLVDNRDGFESCSRLRSSITESKVLLWRSLKYFEVLLAISPNTTRHLSSQLGSSEGSSTYLSITRYEPNSNWLKFMQTSGVSKMQEVWQVRLIACETAVSTLHSWCKCFIRFLMVSLYPRVIFQPDSLWLSIFWIHQSFTIRPSISGRPWVWYGLICWIVVI